nr:MAG TPA: hypothetical protein [Caudoviricetes sp.]
MKRVVQAYRYTRTYLLDYGALGRSKRTPRLIIFTTGTLVIM